MVVLDDKKEVEHLISVLEQTQRALNQLDSFLLHNLSDQTIHSASIQQDTDSLTIAVILYSLNKLVTRKSITYSKEWKPFTEKFNNELQKAIGSLKIRDAIEYTRHLDHAKELLETSSGKGMSAFIQDILKKASINKATKVYEHGISLARTAKLLGLTQWELLDYVGQRGGNDPAYVATMDEKKRASATLAFFG